MSVTFVADKGSICTVLLVRDDGEFIVRVGDEELTSGDLARIGGAIHTLSEEREKFAEAPPRLRTPPKRPGGRKG